MVDNQRDMILAFDKMGGGLGNVLGKNTAVYSCNGIGPNAGF